MCLLLTPLVRTDNTSVVFHINHQGGTRSLPSLQLALALLTWAETRLLSLRARHIPGHLNIAADSLSRGGPRPANWRLHKEIVQLIWNTYSAAAVDLFASKETTHCPLWFAEQVESLGRDALSHEWPDLLLYAFPPIPLIWAVLSRVREMGDRVLLIANTTNVVYLRK